MMYAPVGLCVVGSPVVFGSNGHMIIQCGPISMGMLVVSFWIRIAALSGTGQRVVDAGVRRITRHRSKVTALDWYKVSSYAGEQKSVSRIVEPMAAFADPVIPKPPDR